MDGRGQEGGRGRCLFKFCRLFVSGWTAGGIFRPPTGTLAPPDADCRPASQSKRDPGRREALKVDSFFRTHRGLKFAYGGGNRT